MLVDSKPANAVEISPADLPVALAPMLMAHPPRRDTVLYNRLAKVLGMSTKRKKCPIDGYGVQRLSPIGCAVAQGYAQLSYQDVTIKTDVSKDVQYYLAERQQQFPGVSVQQVWLRRYPLGTLAAQLFGTVGQDHSAGGPRSPLPRRFAERGRRSVGAGVVLRPLPARPGRRRTGPGRRPRSLHRRPVGA